LRDFEKYVFEANAHLDAEDDDARIYYVGFSRAVQSLFINIPSKKADTIQKLQDMNVEYEILA
jgi:ATP-dependent exoDNAse (exonuclease V) beta subunit